MNDVAYIYSHDGDMHGIKFSVELCTDDTLRETMRRHLYPDGDSEGELDAIFSTVLETGGFTFEDGWISVRRGGAIVDFLIDKLRETKDDERYAGEECHKEQQRRLAAEAKYQQLRNALLVALGPNAPELAEKAAA